MLVGLGVPVVIFAMGATGRDRIKRQSPMRRRSKHLIDNDSAALTGGDGRFGHESPPRRSPYPLLWQRFEGEAFGSGPDFAAVRPVAAPGAGG